MMNLIGRLCAVIATAFVLTACGGDGDDSPGTPAAAVASVEVSPVEVTLTQGETMQLRAILRDGSGKVLEGRTVTWTSEDPSKVSVTTAGLARGIASGRSNVRASAEGRSASSSFTVVDPPVTVSRLVLDQVNIGLREGESTQLSATAYDAGGRVIEGRAVQWTTSGPATALVSPGGMVTGLKPGTISVTARVDGVHASATVKVLAEYEYGLVFGKAGIAMVPELHYLDINDPAAHAVPLFAAGQVAERAAPSPDGRKIAFVVFHPGGQSTLHVSNRDGTGVVTLVTLPGFNESPAWSPDGAWIAFSNRPPGGPADIWVVGADGTEPVNLTADQTDSSKSSPAWSPTLADGNYRIAYARASAGSCSLWTMHADGSDKRRLTTREGVYDEEPAWSPDGNRIVFHRTSNGIFGDLYVVSASGGAGTALLPANPLAFGQFSPAWSPDGKLIAFTSKHVDGEHYQVWTVWADGTRLAQRTDEPAQHSDPAWITLP